MRKSLLVFSLLVVLAVPAMAAPRDGGSRDRHEGIISRILRVLKALDDIVPGPPKP